MQFGCFVQRGHYPREDPRLRGTFVVSPVQDVLPVFLDTGGSSSATEADVRANGPSWCWRFDSRKRFVPAEAFLFFSP